MPGRAEENPRRASNTNIEDDTPWDVSRGGFLTWCVKTVKKHWTKNDEHGGSGELNPEEMSF